MNRLLILPLVFALCAPAFAQRDGSPEGTSSDRLIAPEAQLTVPYPAEQWAYASRIGETLRRFKVATGSFSGAINVARKPEGVRQSDAMVFWEYMDRCLPAVEDAKDFLLKTKDIPAEHLPVHLALLRGITEYGLGIQDLYKPDISMEERRMAFARLKQAQDEIKSIPPILKPRITVRESAATAPPLPFFPSLNPPAPRSKNTQELPWTDSIRLRQIEQILNSPQSSNAAILDATAEAWKLFQSPNLDTLSQRVAGNLFEMGIFKSGAHTGLVSPGQYEQIKRVQNAKNSQLRQVAKTFRQQMLQRDEEEFLWRLNSFFQARSKVPLN